MGFRGHDYFPHLGPPALLATRIQSKEAGLWTGIVLTALLMLISGAATLGQFGTVKTEIASLKSELAGMREKLVRLESNVATARPYANERNDGADASLLRRASRSPQEPFVLSRDDIQLIRDFIKVAPSPPGAPRRINLGDFLADTALTPMPEPIMDKLPKLRGARFTIDRNSAIVVVAPGTNQVAVIINPS
jgi:hypothetical protein